MNKDMKLNIPKLSMQFTPNPTSTLEKGFRDAKIKQHASAIAKRNVAMRLAKS